MLDCYHTSHNFRIKETNSDLLFRIMVMVTGSSGGHHSSDDQRMQQRGWFVEIVYNSTLVNTHESYTSTPKFFFPTSFTLSPPRSFTFRFYKQNKRVNNISTARRMKLIRRKEREREREGDSLVVPFAMEFPQKFINKKNKHIFIIASKIISLKNKKWFLRESFFFSSIAKKKKFTTRHFSFWFTPFY